MLKQPITWHRLATIVLGLAGMVVILGGGTGVPPLRGIADWMGLASRVARGFAMVYLQRTASRPTFDRIFAAFVFFAPLYYLTTRLPGSRISAVMEGVAAVFVLTQLLPVLRSTAQVGSIPAG